MRLYYYEFLAAVVLEWARRAEFPAEFVHRVDFNDFIKIIAALPVRVKQLLSGRFLRPADAWIEQLESTFYPSLARAAARSICYALHH